MYAHPQHMRSQSVWETSQQATAHDAVETTGAGVLHHKREHGRQSKVLLYPASYALCSQSILQEGAPSTQARRSSRCDGRAQPRRAHPPCRASQSRPRRTRCGGRGCGCARARAMPACAAAGPLRRRAAPAAQPAARPARPWTGRPPRRQRVHTRPAPAQHKLIRWQEANLMFYELCGDMQQAFMHGN